MKNQKTINTASVLFISVSILALGYVSILSFLSPQTTMSMVNVTLSNNDAISSIRGVYGGVGLTITCSLIWLLFNSRIHALRFLTMFWLSYAISRVTTMKVNGLLGDFGNQWLMIEAFFGVLGVVLLLWNAYVTANKKVQSAQ